MVNGAGVAHLLTEAPPASPSLTYPVPLPLCPLQLSPGTTYPPGSCSFIAIGLVWMQEARELDGTRAFGGVSNSDHFQSQFRFSL
jgi:hypothetical protein